MGKDFRFQFGPFVYCAPALTKNQFLELDKAVIENTKTEEFFSAMVKPANKFAELIHRYISIFELFTQHVPMILLSGVISEYFTFITAIKKKMLGMPKVEIVSREAKKRLTTLQKTQLLENNVIFRKVGLEAFGIT